jgi:NAD(P)-dependent dehydrogenase (short-subunit alcohol dehydrogenase family)
MYIGITEAYSVEQAKFQMETNYFGAIKNNASGFAFSMRKAGSGLIINTSSLVGRMSPPFFGTYTATKHALEGYSQALRYEVSPFGVDIVMVEPGPFGTGLLASGQAPAHSDTLNHMVNWQVFLLQWAKVLLKCYKVKMLQTHNG